MIPPVAPTKDFYTTGSPPSSQPVQDFYATPAGGQGDFYSPANARALLDTGAAAGADIVTRLRTLTDSPSFSESHPILNALIVEPVRDASAAIKYGLIAASGGPSGVPTGGLARLTEYQARRFAEDPVAAQEEQDRALRGTALLASFLPGIGASRLATRFGLRGFGRAAAFLAGEASGGAVYGAIEPLRAGESRGEAIARESVLFGTVGGIFGGAVWAGARAYRAVLGKFFPQHAAKAVERLNRVRQELERAGTSLDALPPPVRAQILENVYRETLEEVAEPARIEGLLRNELAGAAEAREAAPKVASILPDPEEAFAFAEPLEVQGLEPTAASAATRRPTRKPPKGFTPGAQPAEYVTSVVVQGKSGKTYPGLTHPQAMADAISSGVPASEFDRTGRELEDSFGFSTNLREFVSRRDAEAIAARSVGQKPTGAKLDAHDLTAVEGQPGLYPVDAAPEPVSVEGLADVAVRDAVEQTAPLDVASQEVRDAAAEVTTEAAALREIAELNRQLGNERAQLSLIPKAKRTAEQQARFEELTALAKRVEAVLPPPARTAEEAAAATAVPERLPSDILERERRRPELERRQRDVPIASERRAAERRHTPWPPRQEPVEAIRAKQPEELAAPAMDDLATAVRLNDSELEALQREFMRIANNEPSPPSELEVLREELQRGGAGEAEFARRYADQVRRSEAGFVTQETLGRLLSAGVGATALIKSGDDDLDPGTRKVLWALGGMLVAASLHAPVKNWIKNSGFTRRFLLNANPAFLMRNAGSKEGARQYIETLTWSRELSHNYHSMVRQLFNKDSYRAAQLAIDEMNPAQGIFPPEFYQLTPQQQRGAVALHQLNERLHQILKAEGIEEEYVSNYARRVLPSETYQRWQQQGYRPVVGAPGGRVRLRTLREFEQFATANALPEPILRLPDLQALRITEAYRAIGNVRMRRHMEGLGLLIDGPKLATQPMPQGWRTVKILGLQGKIAPEAVAAALENMSSPVASRSEILNAADVLKSWWMRSIMFWFWEHGLNALRALPLVTTNPAGFGTAWKAVRDNDPLVLEAAKHGLNLRARTDYGLRSAKAFEEMAQKVGRIPLIRDVWRVGGNLIEKQDRFLWDQIIPALQLFTYQTEMRKWAQRTGNRFLPGSTEYIAAARKSADFANVVAGRVPTELANPQLMQFMRLAMFSPQWTSTRIALTMGASGELGEVLAGRLNPLHGSYLPFKLRQIAYMTALTWIGSKILSGKEPEFNPRTTKFYMRTGLRNETGREVGLDLAGWWQDELKLFNEPFDFIAGRLNPTLNVIGETITGRDFAGRDMTYPQRIVNLLQSAGPPTELAELGLRIGQSVVPGGAPRMTGGEALGRVSGVLATGNVSALPRPIDAAIARMAEKLLGRAHLPKNDYLVFELSRLLRGNILAGQPLIDSRVLTYLAYRRRSHGIREPIPGASNWLWQHARKVLAEF